MPAFGDLACVLGGLESLAAVVQGELARFHSGMVALVVVILVFQVVGGLGRLVAVAVASRASLAGLVVQGALVGMAVVLLSGRVLEEVARVVPFVRFLGRGP